MRKPLLSGTVLALGLITAVPGVLAGKLNIYPDKPTIDERGSTRQFHWDGQGSPGQFAINYNRPAWKPEFAQRFEELTKGRYWRLGHDFWTILDTNIPLTIAGADVPAGMYYLAVERSQDGRRWQLLVIDSDKARRQLQDAGSMHDGQAPDLPVLFKTALRYRELPQSGEKLTILLSGKPQHLKEEGAEKADAVLLIDYGPHRLSAPIQAHWASPENVFSPHAPLNERGSTRQYYFDLEARRPVGQFAINFNRPQWRPEYAQMMEKAQKETMWRLGGSFWTVLDNNVPIEISGVEIPAGYHYLVVVLEPSDGERRWSLGVVDPVKTRQLRLDAAQVDGEYAVKVPLVQKATLHFSKVDQVAGQVTIQLGPHKDEPLQALLEIAFGPYRLKAAVHPRLRRPETD